MKSRIFALAAMASFATSAVFAAPDGLTEAVVKKMDVPGRQLTLSHGPIENLGMPAMTMGFKVKDPTLLKDVKPGDKLRVRIEEIDGRYTVVRVVPVK
jgi:Cu/Ag efflux protein CusF